MKKILVIEDEPEIRDNIAEILQLSNYEVLRAEDGLSGVELALGATPDLIICDIAMPGLDGYEVLHSLHRHPRTSCIPFIFLTASTEKEQIRKAMTAGADDYLSKPFEGIELLKAVESCFKKRQLRQTAAAQRSPLPGELRPASIRELLRLQPDLRDIHFFHKKQMIYQEGQRPTALYYLVTGKIKVYRIHPDGKEFITNIAGGGEFLGYTALLQDINYQDNTQVLDEGALMLIPKQEFIDLMTADSRVAQYFIDLLARDVKTQEHSLVNLAYNSLRKRVANGLLQLVAKFPEGDGEDISIGISRDNLSHFIGSATESLTRTLSDFRNEKLIDIRDGKIYLLNRERLSRLAN
ncbi:MAG: response regulator [Chitinophagaceae bacterium]|nr:response regulator [Chitinophagaceae bacterium]